MTKTVQHKSSISRAIDAVRLGKEAAAKLLWDRFSGQMTGVARSAIFSQHRRYYGAEEIVNSAFASVVMKLWNNDLEEIRTRNDLWRMLMLALRHKHSDKRKQINSLKRGSGFVQGEMGLEIEEPVDPLTPADLVEINHDFGTLLDSLPDDLSRKTALLRIAGNTVLEIAAELDVPVRNIERRLYIIRKTWSDQRDGD